MIVSDGQWAYSFSRAKLDAYLKRVSEGSSAFVADFAPAVGPVFRDLSGLDPAQATSLLHEIESAESAGGSVFPPDDFI